MRLQKITIMESNKPCQTGLGHKKNIKGVWEKNLLRKRAETLMQFEKNARIEILIGKYHAIISFS
jgi:hypothetical protein